jgi:DNA excision repair protein ERCC-3
VLYVTLGILSYFRSAVLESGPSTKRIRREDEVWDSDNEEGSSMFPPASGSIVPKSATINFTALRRRAEEQRTQDEPGGAHGASVNANDSTLTQHRRTQNQMVAHLFKNQDFAALYLKPDHASRPLWINPEDGHIILEAFSPIAEQAQDFLVAISEPVSRYVGGSIFFVSRRRCERPNMYFADPPSYTNTSSLNIRSTPPSPSDFRLTISSKCAWQLLGRNFADIFQVLNRLSKVPLPKSIVDSIADRTRSYGKVKLVLKHNKYFIESTHPETLQLLLKDKIIREARLATQHADNSIKANTFTTNKAPTKGNLVIPGTDPKKKDDGVPKVLGVPERQNEADLFTSVVGVDNGT